MPSARNQKAKEKLSRRSNVMSDVENLDVMLGNYSTEGVVSQFSENEGNLDLTSINPNMKGILMQRILGHC